MPRRRAGVDEGLDLAAGVQAYHAAVGETGIDAALAVHGGVLGAVQLALAKQLGFHQGVVGFEDPVICGAAGASQASGSIGLVFRAR